MPEELSRGVVYSQRLGRHIIIFKKEINMPVAGLASMQDQYMLDILTMDLPGDHKVGAVWVEITWDTHGEFVAKARMTYEGGSNQYHANGNTIKEALVELAAIIIIEYPLNDDGALDIDIPISEIVKTKTFKKWFDTKQKGDD